MDPSPSSGAPAPPQRGPSRSVVDRRTTGRRATAVAFLAPLALYLATMAPTIYNLDSAELTTAAYSGGLVRATGYPLYLLIGRAWSRLPIGDVGYRMNLLSAVCGALTIALGWRLLRRLGVGTWAAFGALGLLAASRFFWAMSLIAEVYTLHTLMMAAILLALLRWGERPSTKRLALAAFLVGLGFGNHVATVLLAPGALVYVLAVEGRRALRPRPLAAAAGALAAGLAVYLYLPLVYLTEPAFNYVGHYDATGEFQAVDLTTPGGLWWLVSGRAFAHVIMAYTPAELLGEVGHFGGELVRAFMAIGLGPGLLGLAVLLRRRPRRGLLLALMFACSAGFYVNYRVVDKDTMFLPAYLVWALWAGLGYQWLLDWVGHHTGAPGPLWPRRLHHLLHALMAAGVALAVLWNGPLVDLSDDASTRVRGEQILERAQPGALVIGWWSTVPVVEYLQLVEGQRPDVQPLNRFLIAADDLRELILDQLGRRPVYLDEPPDELLPGLEGEQVGPIFRLYRAPEEESAEEPEEALKEAEEALEEAPGDLS